MDTEYTTQIVQRLAVSLQMGFTTTDLNSNRTYDWRGKGRGCSCHQPHGKEQEHLILLVGPALPTRSYRQSRPLQPAESNSTCQLVSSECIHAGCCFKNTFPTGLFLSMLALLFLACRARRSGATFTAVERNHAEQDHNKVVTRENLSRLRFSH